MSSSTPITRQVAWISLIHHFAVFGLIVYLWMQFDTEEPFLKAALTYVLLSFTLRKTIPKHQSEGMKLVKQHRFGDAIPCFERSYAFFTKYAWIDRFRYLVLLSSSKVSYREMALVNLAFCYSQLGDGLRAKEYYERTLVEFPESGIAKAALNMINSIEASKI